MGYTIVSQVAITANDDCVFINFGSDEGTFKLGADQCSFSHAIRELHEMLHVQKRKPTKDEFTAIQIHDAFVQDKVPIEHPSHPLNTSGFGVHQTQLSLTDPGEGHINGTCIDPDRMHGILVHNEHLEREKDDRGIVEPYRMPAISMLAMVLSRVGDAAPCTTYIGRPVFESNDFKTGALKAVRTVGSACSAMFMQGVSECKIAMEGMTATQIVEFMQWLRGEVRRDVYTQILSAAFNLNTPILDDRLETQQKNHGSVWIIDRFEIAQLAVQLCKAGGFEKVTWDGSSNTYPSLCVLEQLSFREAATVVHLAHEQGLLTYFSAGFKFHHLPQAVYTSVDGVGVGGAQILRLMDESTGFHGPFLPENIEKILQIRDEAARDWRGQSAALLARLDQMFFEGCISAQDNALRLELFEAICDEDEALCTTLLEHLTPVRNMPPDQEHCLIEWAKRLLNAEAPLLAHTKNPDEWTTFVEVLH